MTRKIDPTRPFYAVVGAGDLAVEFARGYAADVQARFESVELEPKALRDQARTLVVGRVDDLTKEAKEAQTRIEAKMADLQADAKALPARVESFTSETVAELNDTYGDLAVRGKDLLNRIRKQQATQDAAAAGRTTVAKAKTTKTQTTKSAKASAGNTKQAARKTGSTAKRNTKATGTSAKKTAAATTRAASDASEKVGS